jgi:CBS domain-containing protein
MFDRSLTVMNVLDYCAADPASISLTASAADAIEAMISRGMGAAAVVDENHIVAGIFTERDVLKKIALSGKDPHKILVRDVMSAPVVMATKNTSIAEALQVMVDQQKRHLPVVEENGRLIGILSIRHVLERKVDELTRQLDHAAK